MTTIHPTAVVSPEAELADDVVVGPHTVIDGPVKIAEGVRIIAQAYLTGDTEIGAGCEIHPFVAIGGPPQDYAYEGDPTSCRIGPRNIFREGASVHRGTDPHSTTRIGADGMFMANTHVAHNCTVGDHVVMINGALLAGHVTVGDRAVLGGNAGVHQFVRVGEYAMIGGASRIEQDIAPFMMYAERCQCVGVNRVGLRRNGFTREEIDELRTLHRLLFRSTEPLRSAATQARNTVQTAPGRRLLDFVLADSKRGIGGR